MAENLFVRPPQRQTGLDTFARALQGFSTGLEGRSGEYFAGLQAQDQALSEARQKAMAQDAMQVYQMLGQGEYDRALQLMDDRVRLIGELGGDPTDTVELRQKVATGDLRGAVGDLEMFLGAAQQAGLIAAPAAPEFMAASSITPEGQVIRNQGGRVEAVDVPGLRREQPVQQGYRMLSAQEAATMGLDPSRSYQVNTANQQISAVGGSAPVVNTTTNVEIPGADKYVETRMTGQATAMTDLERSAESAYRANQALDRFIAASASGDAGAAQPIITGVKNFISSFGYDPEGLTDTIVMQSAVGDILGAKMAELGARGLTDQDMKILREALPRVETSHEARVQVANIIRKSNINVLREYDNQVRYEEEAYPDANFRRPSWLNSVREQGFADDPLGLFQTGAR